MGLPWWIVNDDPINRSDGFSRRFPGNDTKQRSRCDTPLALWYVAAQSLGFIQGMTYVHILPFIFIGIFCAYKGAVNTVRALSEKPVHYSPSIPFVK